MSSIRKRFALAGIVIVCVGLTVALTTRSMPVDVKSPERTLSNVESPLFTDITTEAGVDFVQNSGKLAAYCFPAIMGGGCAILDFNQDGRQDLFLVDGPAEHCTNPGTQNATETHNRLYRQNDDGTFADATTDSGLQGTGCGMGVAVGDVNNDGFPDLYLTGYGPDHLYLNQQDGTFIDVTAAAGIQNIQWSASACFVDLDRDGWLDLYVTNYVDYFPEQTCHDTNGQPEFCGPQVFFAVHDRLFRNLGGALSQTAEIPPSTVAFEDVSVSSGIASQASAGLGVICDDFNGDHWPDIYVANDRMANLLWINQQDRTFTDEAFLRGVAVDSQGRPQAGMGIGTSDLNHDSVTDLYVTHMNGETNALYLSESSGVFREQSAVAGLLVPTFPATAFGTAFNDLNHDGFSDILVAAGRVKRETQPSSDTVTTWADYAENNAIFLGDASNVFQPSSTNEPFCQSAGISRGLAMGDLDGDGDLDLLLSNLNGPTKLFRNDAVKKGTWLTVTAVDPSRGNRDALGARVSVVAAGIRRTQTVQSCGSYLSACQPVAHFGMGDAKVYDQLEVIWPDGSTDVYAGGATNTARVVAPGNREPLNE